ncbi:uroporphyrinogen decarboxylase family protein [Planctomycetota bacterium]
MGLTRKERLTAAYFHEEMDRPAVYTRTGYPGNDPTYDGLKALMNAHSDLKASVDTGYLDAAIPFDDRTEPHSEDFERYIVTYHMPKGDLEQTSLVSLKGQPGLHETHLIKTREDVETYLSLPVPDPQGDMSRFADAEKEIGDAGIVDVNLGTNPGGFAADLCGSENFAIMSVMDRDTVCRLMERRMNVLINRLKYLLDHDIGPFFSMLGEEYIVPPLHGPQDFNDFNVKYDKPIIDLVHAAGGRIHIHSHGSVSTVLDGFLEMGTDVLHPFEPPTMGDITPAQAKERVRGRCTIEGNIQIADLYEKDPDYIRAHTEALIRDAFDDRKGLIVAPTASPYLRGRGEQCLPQYQAMVETVLGSKTG